MNVVSISEVEQAINQWRERRPSDRTTFAVCPEVSVLGDLYGLMIYERLLVVPWVALDERQQAAMSGAGFHIR